MICNKCASTIPDLNFSEEQLLEIRGLAAHGLKIFLVSKLLELDIDHGDAKLIADHLNPNPGECQSCKSDELEGENTVCPKCGAFNYNLPETPFNDAFCSRLEYALDFDSLDEEVKGFWCDGISAFPADMKSLSKEAIRNSREITTDARIGKDGQDRYRMTIEFGSKAVDYYERGLNLEHCIPESDYKYWIKINPEKQEIRVLLD